MTFRVRVNIEVVNEEGDVVDYRGHPGIVLKSFTPLSCNHDMHDQDRVQDAHHNMNTLFQMVRQMDEMK